MTTVWVITREYQADTPQIEGVFASHQSAYGHVLFLQREAIAAGEIVEDINDDDEDWTVNFRLEKCEVYA